MRIYRWRDATRQPWRNGGGITHELLREPPEPAPFDLRLSIAEIGTDGPFSRFPGVDRVITLVEGVGFRLRSAAGVVERTRPGEPFSFVGEDDWYCSLIDGPVRDFNVMVRRGAARPVLFPSEGGPVELGQRGFVLALADGARVDGVPLDRWDLAEGTGSIHTEGSILVILATP